MICYSIGRNRNQGTCRVSVLCMPAAGFTGNNSGIFALLFQNNHTYGGNKMNPYENCPIYENENYLLRLVKLSDAPDLLLVYSDEKAVPFFNSDNCNGDDFHYTTLERMESAIGFWRWAYEQHAFVRWTVISKNACHARSSGDNRADGSAGIAVGTIELFHRQAHDYYHDCGLLRLDLGSGHETLDSILEILSLIVPTAFDLFNCGMVATKIPPFAASRIAAAEALGFTASAEKLVGGDDGKSYGDYYVLLK